MLNRFLEKHAFHSVPEKLIGSGLLLIIAVGCTVLLGAAVYIVMLVPIITTAICGFFALLSAYFKATQTRDRPNQVTIPHTRKCSHNHAVELVKCDLSKVYDNGKCKEMWQMRCAIDDTCEFSEYYHDRADAYKELRGE